MSEQIKGTKMASITTDLIGFKKFSCTIYTVFMVGSTLPSVLTEIRFLCKMDEHLLP